MSSLITGLSHCVCWGGILTTLVATPQQVVRSQQSPVKDHQLFVGVDLVVKHDEELVGVRKIENKNALLDNPAREVISLRDSDGLQWRLATKVSATSAKIDLFKSKRVLSPAKNPVLTQLRDGQALQDFVSDQVAQREQAIRDVIRSGGATPTADAQTEEVVEAEVANLVGEIDGFRALGDSSDRATNSPHAKMGFDAVQFSFEISSPTPIADAYVVAILRITVEGEFRDTSFYRHIGRVDESPRKVKFLQAGLPSDYEIKEARVHLYWQGEEIPTNFSEKNYAVTSTEAKTFLQMDHLGRHRYDSAAASPAWSMVPPALLAAENSAEYDLPVTVELDAEGQLVAIQSSHVIVPDRVRAIVEQMTFLPAVERGKGIPSTLTVNPADFFKIN